MFSVSIIFVTGAEVSVMGRHEVIPYDSVCSGGLSCVLAVGRGDRHVLIIPDWQVTGLC